MKGLIIADFDFLYSKNSGIAQKVKSMAKAFEKNSVCIDLFCMEGMYSKFMQNNESILDINNNMKDKYSSILHRIQNNKYDFIFIRYLISDYFFIEFLKKMKELDKNIKIILEFPTFPYDAEIKNGRILNVDKYFREYLNKYVDLGVVYNNVSSAFGIKTFLLGNGIETKDKLLLNYKCIENHKIRMIGIGNISIWHGYDRVILGIDKYIKNKNYDDTDIEFLIIGNGAELGNLINITNKLKLNRYVKFVGYKSGAELQQLYQTADVGIGTLSRSRINMEDGSALKNREYCALGLPFVYSGIDTDFSNKFKYALRIEDNEESVDVKMVINFVDNIKKNTDYISEMRKYAENNLDWNIKINKVLDEINKIN